MNKCSNKTISYNNSKLVELNPSGYKFLMYLSMIYLSIMFCNAILTNRYIGTDEFFVLGGTFTSPFIFILDDIIAEIYGYKITRSVIFTAFAAQTLFIVICQLVFITPYPSHFKSANSYESILGPNLLRIGVSSFIAYIIANLVNSYIITKWKILLKGRKFWLRSMFSSAFSEALYSFIAILMMETYSVPFRQVLKIAIISYLIKAIYSVIFSAPANLLVIYIKSKTGIDVYDLPIKFTPFTQFSSKRETL